METQKILVTGGKGFIGLNLVPELERRGHEVWVCDLMHSEGDNYNRCDISKFRQVERIFEHQNFDYLYHLAAEYGRWNGEDYYENLWMTNVVGTKNMIRLQEKKQFRMIFFSSAEVYGDYEGIMTEDVMEKNPIKDSYQMNDYAITNPFLERKALPKELIFLVKVFACKKFVYNVAGRPEWEMDIEDYSDLVLKAWGDDSIVTYMEAEPFTTKVKTIDCSKAVRDLRHDPKVAPKEGIKRTVEWMKRVYSETSYK